MATVTLTANKSARANYLSPHTNFSTETESPNETLIFLGFPRPSSAYDYLPLISFELHLYGSSTKIMELDSSEVLEAWQENTLTWNNKPDSGSIRITSSIFGRYLSKEWIVARNSSSAYASAYKKIINYGLVLRTNPSYSGPGVIDNSRSTNKPYIVVTFGDDPVTLTPKGTALTNGYISKHVANTFKWSTVTSGVCLGDVTVANSKFRWKTSAGATPTTIDCGTAREYTFAAEAITSDSFLWQAETTDSNGVVSTSPWYTLTTVESTSTAEIITPNGAMLDGSIDNEFAWHHIIATGTAQTKADLQMSNNGGSTWTSLATVTGSNTAITVPANTFTAGEWLWKVRTYNSDAVAGSWSESASFICVASPTVQGVSATNTPRPLISWQSDEQVAYQIRIGGYASDTIFGTASTFKSPMYLDDDIYPVAVRVQNRYGLWSEWEFTETTVSNVPGDSIELFASNENGIAVLQWGTTEDYSAFVVYRDGAAIAKIETHSYEDHMAIGSHSYFVRGILDGDYYGVSNTETLELSVTCLMIADAKTKTWLKLNLSTSSISERGFGHTAEARTRKVFASAYPVAETSKYLEKNMTARVAFIDDSEEAMFEALIGKIVIVKTPRKEMVCGPLTSISKTENTFFNGYAFNVTHTYYDEEIEL